MNQDRLGDLLGWSPEMEQAYWDVMGNCTQVGDCFLYAGKKNNRGYGYLKVRGKTITTSRLILEHGTGPRPDELQAGHICGNRACVNLEHLVWVTLAENSRMREYEKFMRTILSRIGRNLGARLSAPLPITLNLGYFSDAIDVSALFE